MELAFISIKDNIIYVGQYVEVARGIKRKNQSKEKEVLIFGCSRNNVPDRLKSILEPYLKYKEFFKRFDYE